MSSLPVKPELGPTLPELLRPWWRRAPFVVRAAATLVAAAIAVLLVLGAVGGATTDETHVVVRDPVAFNLRYGPTVDRVDPARGELLSLRVRRDGEVVQSFTVTPLRLAPYKGLAAGELPVMAEALKDRLAQRFSDFTLVEEGRTRINEMPGYEVVFAARDDQDRRVYGRWVMITTTEEPGVRDGVTMQLLARWSTAVPSAGSLGDQGELKLPLRSFRFGTEAP